MSERSDAIGALYAALHRLDEVDNPALLQIICATLEDLRNGPLPALTDLAHTADVWAEMTAPVEMEAYLAAIARRLPETPIHNKARKRIVAGMFVKMAPDERKRFIVWAEKHQDDAE